MRHLISSLCNVLSSLHEIICELQADRFSASSVANSVSLGVKQIVSLAVSIVVLLLIMRQICRYSHKISPTTYT